MPAEESHNLERILESAVVVNWAGLTRDAERGLVHIEYGFAPSGSLDYLQLWSSRARGHWLLACAYWMSPSKFHEAGLHFENGYQAEGLAEILETVMQNQGSFVLPANLGRQGLLEITTPTPEEYAAAAVSVREACAYADSALPAPATT